MASTTVKLTCTSYSPTTFDSTKILGNNADDANVYISLGGNTLYLNFDLSSYYQQYTVTSVVARGVVYGSSSQISVSVNGLTLAQSYPPGQAQPSGITAEDIGSSDYRISFNALSFAITGNTAEFTLTFTNVSYFEGADIILTYDAPVRPQPGSGQASAMLTPKTIGFLDSTYGTYTDKKYCYANADNANYAEMTFVSQYYPYVTPQAYGYTYFVENQPDINYIQSVYMCIKAVNWRIIYVRDASNNNLVTIQPYGQTQPDTVTITPDGDAYFILVNVTTFSDSQLDGIRLYVSGTTSTPKCDFYGSDLYIIYYTKTPTPRPALPSGYYRAVLTPTLLYTTSSSWASNNYGRDVTNATYNTVVNTPSSTYSSGAYAVRGFDFSQVPSGAKVVSWTARVKAYQVGVDTSHAASSTIPLPSGQISMYAGRFYLDDRTGDTLNLFSRPIQGYGNDPEPTQLSDFSTSYGGTLIDWDTLKSYGDDVGFYIILYNQTSGEQSRLIFYGAEIEVIYCLPSNLTLTVTNHSTNYGTVTPSGTISVPYGTEQTITIDKTYGQDTILLLNDYLDCSSDIVSPGTTASTSTVLGTYTLISGSFNSSGGTYFSGLVGKGYDNSTQTTTNYYASSSSQNAVFTYDVGITTLPSNATITDMYLMVNGHAESTSNASEYMCVQLKSGSTYFSDMLNFKSVGTSNSTQKVQATSMPTVAQLAAMKVECQLGYYGGALNGATLFVEYSSGSASGKYDYTFKVTKDAQIDVYIDLNPSQGLCSVSATKTGTGYSDYGLLAPTAIYLVPPRTSVPITIIPQNRIRPVFLYADGDDVTGSLSHTEYALSELNEYKTSEFTVVSGGFYDLSTGDYDYTTEDNFRDVLTGTSENIVYAGPAGSGVNDHVILTYDIGAVLPQTAHVESVNIQFNIEGDPDHVNDTDYYYKVSVISGEKTLADLDDYSSSATKYPYWMPLSWTIAHAGLLPSVEELANMKLRLEMGKYGGGISTPFVNVTYSTNTSYYSYTYTTGDAAGYSGYSLEYRTDSFHTLLKKNSQGNWVVASTGISRCGNYMMMSMGTSVWKKENGTWTRKSNLVTALNDNDRAEYVDLTS
jgi:hypothetical protein